MGKAFLINFGIAIFYAAGLILLSPAAGMLIAFLLSLVHVLVCFILGIVFIAIKKEDTLFGIGFLISGVVILLVGLGSCFILLANEGGF